jgi:hypothetical protein
VAISAAERRLRSQIGAHISWARTENRSARTLPARLALLDKFEKQADPEGKLLPAERAKAAESLRRAYYARLALKSAQARRRRAKPRQQAGTSPGTPEKGHAYPQVKGVPAAVTLAL